MPLPDGAAAVWAAATRITDLNTDGTPAPGNASFVTDTLVKCTITPVTATGDDIEIKNANGDLSVFAKHGDIPKYGTVSVELATPDPALEQLLCGGVTLADLAAALGTATGLAAVGQVTLGSLAAGSYGYRASLFNQYGESLPQATVTGTVASGTTGAVVLSGVTIPAGALGARVYGRTQGIEQLLGTIPNIGSQATSVASGTGTPTSLTVTALTRSVPAGTRFQIAGDTNAVKIVFTTTAFAPLGVVTLPVSTSQAITTTIAAGALVPVFVDTGVVAPNGNLPLADTTAGPGVYTGYQAPALGVVANPDGVSIEFYEKAIVGGYQASSLPWWRILLPRVSNFHVMPRDVTNANMASVYEGQAFENPSWGTGPFGDWQFDSSKYIQRVRCGPQVVPVPSKLPAPAIF